METLRDREKPTDDYWNDEDLDEIPKRNLPPNRLIKGINLKDLCDGKEVLFEISKDNDEDILEDNGVSEEIMHCDTKTLREKRGAPLLNTSFREIASKMTNVTDDGLVKKQIIINGTGKTVTHHSYVTVHYNLYKESSKLPFDSTYLRNRPEKFRLDQGEIILGLESAIKSMKKNENSIFFIKWEVGFGAMGCPDRIEKKCDIVADVTLLNFVEVDKQYDLSNAEISKIDFNKFLNTAKQSLCNGSEEFSKGDAKAAVISYRKALKILNSLNLADSIQERQMLKEKLKCLVNLAVCYNKLGKSEQACTVCQEALAIDANSVKANFHYGRANIALSNFPAARRFLLRADKLKPNDKEIHKELKKLNDKKALYELKDKLFWTKAFENEEKEKNAEEEAPSPLTSFEKSLIASLEECTKEDKPHILPLPLLDDELEICERVAVQMKMEMEIKPHSCIFKPAKNNFVKSSK